MHRANSIPGSDAALVEGLRQRDRDAMATLYDRYSVPVFGLIVRIVPDEGLAEDVLKQTFLEAWRTVDSYDGATLELSTWLMCLARSCALESLRSQGVLPNADGGDINDILQKLQPEHRLLIDLVYYRGFTNEDAARALAMPLDTFKSHLRTAMLQLRKHCSEVTQPQ